MDAVMNVCTEDTSGQPLDSWCGSCGHLNMLHPGRGGAIDGCIVCVYLEQYKDFQSRQDSEEMVRRMFDVEDDREALLDVIALMVDQYCFTHHEDEWDSRSTTAPAVAMRVLAKNGRFRITYQHGQRVTGELLRKPPWTT